MPRYDFECPRGHVTEHAYPMSEIPEAVICDANHGRRHGVEGLCGQSAARVFSIPIVQVRDPGRRRRRRPNPGDDLPRDHDADAAAIARSLR